MELSTDNISNPKVLVIGLGNVAVGYDFLESGTRRKSHLFSITDILALKNIRPDLYGVDINPDARMAVSVNFPDFRCFSSISELPSIQFDIVIVSVPISVSYLVTLEVIRELKFRYLLLEKPAASNKAEANELNALLSQIPNVYILYPRRSLESSRFLRDIYSREVSASYQIEVYFSGAPENILSHFIDLLEYIFGKSEGEKFDFESITYVQTSDVNRNDHSIHILGPIETRYTRGGEEIEIKGLGFPEIIQDFKSQIESQIWYTAKEYLGVFEDKSIFPFPSQISTNIMSIMKGS